jgi:glycosyltransferase involved in cell wall biosynthesis
MTGLLERQQWSHQHELLWHKHSACLSRCRNLGLQRARSPILIFLDDDLVVPPSFVESHIAAHTNQDRMVVMGLRNSVPFKVWSKAPLSPYDYMYGHSRTDPRAMEIQADELQTHPWVFVSGSNLSVRRNLAIDIGLFDENYLGWGFEDVDIAYRLYRHGANFHLMRDAIPIHMDNSSSRDLRNSSLTLEPHKVDDYFGNGEYFLRKFGDDPIVPLVVHLDRWRRLRSVGTETFESPQEQDIDMSGFYETDHKGDCSFPAELSLFTPYTSNDETRLKTLIQHEEDYDS